MPMSDKKTYIYICGPVTGKPELNRPAFDFARKRLERVGYEVVVPHDFVPAHATHDYAMELCFARLSQGDIDGVALLDGWKASKGSCMEVVHAEDLGIEVWPVKLWVMEAKCAT